MSYTLLTLIHALAALIWVGGMFFAYLILRPAAMQLEPPLRLRLWGEVLQRFFVWVWGIIIALPLSGYALVSLHMGGMARMGTHVALMQVLAGVMIIIFVALYLGPYRRLQAAIASETWPEAGIQLNRIRQLVAINLALGLVTVTLGVAGRFFV